MIDFRYHLVSLVSVFIALAIGVVLGAGPLRESIGDTLTNQVDALRQDKENLQLAVGNRDEQIRQRDQFISAVAPEIVAEQLGGRTVVVVTTPDAGREAVDLLTDQVRAAGAEVTGRVNVTAAWADPEQQEFRRSLAGQLVPYLETPPDVGGGAGGDLAAVLAWAISAPDVGAAEEEDPNAATVVEGLRGGNLITVDGDVTQRATLALLVTGAPEQPADDDAVAAAEEASAAWLPLVDALDQRAAGTVVAGPLEAAAPGGLLTLLRADETAEGTSTTDAADTPAGRVVAVWALREQLAGDAGHYGFGEGAQALLPDIAAPSDQ